MTQSQQDGIFIALFNFEGSSAALDAELPLRALRVNRLKEWGYLETREGIHHITEAGWDFLNEDEILLLDKVIE